MTKAAAGQGLATVSALTVFALLIAGYHPYAEDGGVYVAGIEKLLHPALFPTWTAFVTEHLRFSIFAPLLAAMVRITHLPLPWVLLALYIVSIAATLAAGWMLATRFTESTQARRGAVALLACWLTLPIAGTSLMLMDPYLTARSFTTPLTLAALAWALDAMAGRRRAWLFCATSLLFAALLHPLMAGYGLAAVATLCCCRLPARKWLRRAQSALLPAALTVAFVVQRLAPSETPEYVQVALTRYYWFPFSWHWYEQLGLIGPLLILLWLRHKDTPGTRTIAHAGLALGVIASLIAAIFAHESYATHLVARLQPLRAFQIVYELMILLLGAWLGQNLLKRHAGRWAVTLAAIGTVMFLAQRNTYPNSAHFELPWREPTNPWQQAFLWARENTPQNALFALDAHYITQGRHEDAQCFRAIAQRSALPDYSKDGGEASISPSLTAAWTQGVEAQTNLESESDAERFRKLHSFSVSWIVLQSTSTTGWTCPYRNGAVKVCKLP